MQNGKNNGSDLVAKNAIALNPTKRNQVGRDLRAVLDFL